MPNQQKIDIVAALRERAGKAKSMVFLKYSGLTVADQQVLRQKVVAAGGEMLVTRNRLLNIALGEAAGLKEMLQDQLLTVFSYEDEVSAVKALYEFMKNNENPEVRGGFLEARVLSTAEVDQLAKTPGKTELIAQLLSVLQGPARGLRNVVEGVPGNLVRVLDAIRAKKSQGEN